MKEFQTRKVIWKTIFNIINKMQRKTENKEAENYSGKFLKI